MSGADLQRCSFPPATQPQQSRSKPMPGGQGQDAAGGAPSAGRIRRTLILQSDVGATAPRRAARRGCADLPRNRSPLAGRPPRCGGWSWIAGCGGRRGGGGIPPTPIQAPRRLRPCQAPAARQRHAHACPQRRPSRSGGSACGPGERCRSCSPLRHAPRGEAGVSVIGSGGCSSSRRCDSGALRTCIAEEGGVGARCGHGRVQLFPLLAVPVLVQVHDALALEAGGQVPVAPGRRVGRGKRCVCGEGAGGGDACPHRTKPPVVKKRRTEAHMPKARPLATS